MLEELLSQAFWVGLAEIVGINLILSGDNAVVIALAARSLPRGQQEKAIFWGSAGAVVLRVLLTLCAVALLRLAWVKLVGGALLLWIGVKLLVPESSEDSIHSHDNLIAAIRTILIADLVMSLDNVIGVAAAAGGSLKLLVLGLGISIPMVIFGSTLLLRLMERVPAVVTLGAALIGFVAGEMAAGDRALGGWLQSSSGVAGIPPESLSGLAAALAVVAVGRWLARRRALEPQAEAAQELSARRARG